MELSDEFEVGAPIETVWNYLLDLEKVAPCAPGAELTEVVDERTYKGKVKVKLGPVSMSFAGTVLKQEEDESERRVVLKADGREQRGKGAASALVTANLEPAGDERTKVAFVTDLTITGAAAQYGRGMIKDISARMTKQFAECLQTNIAASVAEAAAPAGGESAGPDEGGPAPTGAVGADGSGPQAGTEPPWASGESRPPTASAAPVQGLSLGLWAVWRMLTRGLRRAFGPEGSTPARVGVGVAIGALAFMVVARRRGRGRARSA